MIRRRRDEDDPVPHERVSGVAREGWGGGEPYGGDAFHRLLSIERKRSTRSGRTFLLLLVDLDGQAGVKIRMAPTVAAAVLSGLRAVLRGTDFVGWYQEGRIAGAVLTESCPPPGTDVARLVAQRVRDALGARLAPEVVRGLRVRVRDEPESSTIKSSGLQQLGIGPRQEKTGCSN